jgi:hypothetical protein
LPHCGVEILDGKHKVGECVLDPRVLEAEVGWLKHFHRLLELVLENSIPCVQTA